MHHNRKKFEKNPGKLVALLYKDTYGYIEFDVKAYELYCIEITKDLDIESGNCKEYQRYCSTVLYHRIVSSNPKC